MTDSVLVRREGEIAVVTLNRPAVMNAVDESLRDGLIATLKSLNADEAVRAVIVTGAGERAFCAGQDLAVSTRLTAETVGPWTRSLHGFYQAVRDMDKPTICALNGVAAGAGLQIALHSDMRLAHPGVRMGQPEIDAGLPSVIGSMIMREVLGLSRMVDLALTCRLADAEECRRFGLVNRVVPRERLMDAAMALAASLAAQPPIAVKLTKRRVRELTQPAYDAAIERAVALQREAFVAGEPQAEAAAFLARRAARAEGTAR